MLEDDTRELCEPYTELSIAIAPFLLSGDFLLYVEELTSFIVAVDRT
jgi:hypothetical protein